MKVYAFVTIRSGLFQKISDLFQTSLGKVLTNPRLFSTIRREIFTKPWLFLLENGVK
jgi:hypothetical protein